jgi:hypothetical protein
MVEFTRGTRVKVRLAGGRYSYLRVVEVLGSTVYVTSEARYEAAIPSGKRPAILLGVPKYDLMTP